MTDEEKRLVSVLEQNVRELIHQYEELGSQNAQLWKQVADDDAIIQKLREQNKQLSEQYANLKIARTLQLSDNDTREAKQRLGKLVREVDKCIAILKAE